MRSVNQTNSFRFVGTEKRFCNRNYFRHNNSNVTRNTVAEVMVHMFDVGSSPRVPRQNSKNCVGSIKFKLDF